MTEMNNNKLPETPAATPPSTTPLSEFSDLAIGLSNTANCFRNPKTTENGTADSGHGFSGHQLNGCRRNSTSPSTSSPDVFTFACSFDGVPSEELEVFHEGDHLIIEAPEYFHCEKYGNQRVVRLPADVRTETMRCEINPSGELVVSADRHASDHGPRKHVLPVDASKRNSQDHESFDLPLT